MTQDVLSRAFDDERLRAAAARSLAGVDGSVAAVERIRRGNRKSTALVRFEARDPAVLQVCPEMRWLRTETAILRRLRAHTEVPVPPVIAAGRHGGVAYMLTRYVAGEDLHGRFASLDPERRRALARSFGSHLAAVHRAFEFGGYGRVESDGDSLTARRGDWGSWFREYAQGALDRLPTEFDPLRARLRELVVGSEQPESPPARLYSWDLRPGNALLADGEIAAILDWEAPLSAPPSLSVAKAEYLVADWYVREPEPLRAAFREGYESVRSYPAVPAAHRVAAIADSAVDSTGSVTNPRYPELDRREAVAFHRDALERASAADGRSTQTAGRERSGQ